MAKTGYATCPACKKGQLHEIGKDERNSPIYECRNCGEKLVELAKPGAEWRRYFNS
jgi:uncharacterized Zn finger protein